MKLHTCLICIAALLVAATCEREEGVRTQLTPKNPSPAGMNPGPGGAAPQSSAQQNIGWRVPDGWTELPSQEMRFAAFEVSKEHPDVRMTVIPLGPESRDLKSNVNRWEQQLGLPASAEDQLDKVVKHVDVGEAHIDVVDLIGPASSDGKPQQRMLAAILPTDSQVWFFKLVGPDNVVSAQKANFDAFLQTIHFSAGDPHQPPSPAAGAQQPSSMPAGHPPMPAGHPPIPAPGQGQPQAGASPMGAAPGLDMSPDTDAGLTWMTPDGWRQDPNPRPMRAATFFVGPPESQAELIVSRLSARSPGSFMDNVNRWRGQLGLGPVADPSTLETIDLPVGQVQGRAVEIINEQTGLAMRVAIAAHEQDLWFFKLTGPSAVVNDQKDEFDAFLKSVQFGQ